MTTMTVYTGIAVRKVVGPFQLVIVGYSPDGGKHYSVERFYVGMN
jgi:hypothetical protein